MKKRRIDGFITAHLQSAEKRIMGHFQKKMQLVPPTKKDEMVLKNQALRNTLLSRIHSHLEAEFRNPLIAKIAQNDYAPEVLKALIIKNRIIHSITSHPTEGQSLATIKRKYIIQDAEILLAEVLYKKHATITDIVRLCRLYKNLGTELDIAKLEQLSSLVKSKKQESAMSDFLIYTHDLEKLAIDQIIDNPLGHKTKMNEDREVELLTYHIGRFKEHVSVVTSKSNRLWRLVYNRRDNLLEPNDIDITTWGGDIDGKGGDAVKGIKFEKASRTTFAKHLQEKIEDLALVLSFNNIDTEQCQNMLTFLEAAPITSPMINRESVKTQLLQFAAQIPISNNFSLQHEVRELMRYIKGSNLSLMKTAYSSREESQKTESAISNIFSIIKDHPSFNFKKSSDFSKLSEIEKIEALEYLYEEMHLFAPIIAQEIAQWDNNTKRQFLWYATSMSFHETHEHIISYFRSRVSDFAAPIVFAEMVRHVAPLVKDHLQHISLKEDLKTYQTVTFSDKSLAKIQKSHIIPSPLAEEEETIIGLTDSHDGDNVSLTDGFYSKLYQTPWLVKYINDHNAGERRETRSNSDGSANMGAYSAQFYNTLATIKSRAIADKHGHTTNILAGVGDNDLSRLGSHTRSGLTPRMTIQGADAQHLSYGKILQQIILEDNKTNETALTELIGRYSEAAIKGFVQHMMIMHKKSETGISLHQAKTSNSNFAIHRGNILGYVIKQHLGRLSSRKAARGTKKAAPYPTPTSNESSDFSPLAQSNNVRRIGQVNLQRLSGMQTFLMAPFFDKTSFDERFLSDTHHIPMFRDIAFSGLLGLGMSDSLTFLIANGIHNIEQLGDTKANAAIFERLQENPSKAQTVTAKDARIYHMCWTLEKRLNVLKNAITPLIHNISYERKDAIFNICHKLEACKPLDDSKIQRLTIKACLIASRDPNISSDLAQHFQTVATRLFTLQAYVGIRRKFMQKADQALSCNDMEAFDQEAEKLALLTRGSGNPGGTGRKVEDLAIYHKAVGYDKIMDRLYATSPLEYDDAFAKELAAYKAIAAYSGVVKSGGFRIKILEEQKADIAPQLPSML
jgi:hypothetical protein